MIDTKILRVCDSTEIILIEYEILILCLHPTESIHNCILE